MAESSLNLLIRAEENASKALAAINQRVRELRQDLNRLSGQNVELSDDFEEAEDASEGLSSNVEDATDNTRELANRTDQTRDGFNQAGQEARGLDSILSDTRARVVAIGAAITAIVASVTKMTQAFFELDRAVTEVATLVDTTVVSSRELTGEVLALSNQFGVAGTEVAQGLYQAISAGAQQGAEANNLLTVAIKTAQAGVTDVNTSVDGLTTVINAFGKGTDEAEQVADVLFTTMRNGKTTIEELSGFMFQAAPLAAALGVSFEDLSASIVGLTLQGTKTSVAMTQIRAAIAGIIRPTEELTKVFNDAGFESAKAAIASEGLGGALELVRTAAGGSEGELLKMVGSIEAAQAILGLTGQNARFFSNAAEQMANSAGALQTAFDTVSASISERFRRAIVRVGNFFIAIGNIIAPVIVTVTEAFAAILGTLGDFINENQDLLQVVTAVVASLTGLGAAIFVGLRGFRLIRGLLAPTVTAFGVVDSKLVEVTKSLLGIGQAGTQTRERLSEVWKFLTRDISSFVPQIKRLFTDFTGTLVGLFGSLVAGINKVITVLRTLAVTMVTHPLFLPATLTAVAAFSINIAAMNQNLALTNRELDQLRQRTALFANENVVRGAQALVREVENLGNASAETTRQLLQEVEARRQIIQAQIEDLEKQQAATEGFTGSMLKFFGLLDDNPAQREFLKNLRERAANLDQAIETLNSTLSENEGNLNDVASGVKEITDSIELAEGSIDSFINDLRSLQGIRFDAAQEDLQARARARTAFLQAAQASQRTLFEAEVNTSEATIALKEREIRELLNLEEERLSRKRTLLQAQEQDEVELATKLQALGAESVSTQIDLVNQLISVRRDQISRTQDALTGLVSEAIRSRQQLAGVLTDIDRRIRQIELSDLDEEQRRNQLKLDAARALADAQIAIEEQRFDKAEELAKRFSDLISEQQFVPTAASGVQLETEDVVNRETVGLLNQLKQLQIDITRAREQDARVQQRTGTQFIQEQQNEIRALEDQLLNLQGISARINLSTNIGDIQNALSNVQGSLGELAGREVPINFRLSGVDSGNLFNILQNKTLTVDANFTGIETLRTAAQELEEANRQILSDARIVLAEIRAISGNVGGGAQGFSSGGAVSGPGTSTSDSILARLSSGEYVVRAEAVRRYGSAFFDAVNNMQLRVPRFARGGQVGGGPGQADRVDINFNIGREIFRLQGDRETAKNLARSLRRMSGGLPGG